MTAIDFYTRRAGVLLHPTSLPSGVLDADADRWLDVIAAAGFSVWQVLPLGEPQTGLSPYQCESAFAINPALLRDYPATNAHDTEFQSFCTTAAWLEDYATFKLLHRQFKRDAWYEWPDVYKHRDADALAAVRVQYAEFYLLVRWKQYQLHRRWQQIKQRAHAMGILLFGDMPLFIAHDSADVWANPQRFMLADSGQLRVVAGVPPDYYSATGQRWGNPHFNWDYMRDEAYAWWLQRMDDHLALFDVVRIDHFRGLEASWVIAAECPTAVDGHWEKMPGDELLFIIREHVGHLPVVAEDLGIITPEVTALRKKYALPGMAVMQFGFDAFEDNPHKPQNIELDRVVYTGTHDNDTTRGWYESLAPEVQRQVLERFAINPSLAGTTEVADRIVSAMIESALQTRGSWCMVPLQDVLHLGAEARMNTPGTTEGNWQWTFKWPQLEGMMVQQMRPLIEQSGRVVKR